MRVRAERMALQVKRDISDIIRSQIKDPRVGFITVTDVEVSNDLTHAKVFVSVFGSQEERQATMETLERATGFIRSEIGRRIRLRVTPELQFKLDESAEYGARIGRVLQDLGMDTAKGEREHGQDSV